MRFLKIQLIITILLMSISGFAQKDICCPEGTEWNGKACAPVKCDPTIDKNCSLYDLELPQVDPIECPKDCDPKIDKNCCPKGTEWNGKECLQVNCDPKIDKNCCPKGTEWNGKECLQVKCSCPAGSVTSPEESECIRTLQADPIAPISSTPMVVGDRATNYYQNAVALVDVHADPMRPFNANALGNFSGRNSPLFNSLDVPLPFTSIRNNFATGTTFSFLRSRVTTTPNAVAEQIYNFHTSQIAVAPQNEGDVFNQWQSMPVCVDVPETKNYLIHLGGDNRWELEVDGVSLAKCDDRDCFKSGLILKETLSAGPHVFNLKVFNDGGQIGFWFEILKNSFDESGDNPIQNVTSEAQLDKVFSTKNLVDSAPPFSPFSTYQVIPNSSFYNATNGSMCPAGYTYNPAGATCGTPGECVKIERFACQ